MEQGPLLYFGSREEGGYFDAFPLLRELACRCYLCAEVIFVPVFKGRKWPSLKARWSRLAW